jgi:cytochrome c-type biogenesis protein CcmH/NrfF
MILLWLIPLILLILGVVWMIWSSMRGDGNSRVTSAPRAGSSGADRDPFSR